MVENGMYCVVDRHGNRIQGSWQVVGREVIYQDNAPNLPELRLRTVPGAAFKRMSRPTAGTDGSTRYGITRPWQREIEQAITQLASLVDRVMEICRVVHPEGVNLDAYGHEIREVLILACTEVEAQCRAVLLANGYPLPKGGRMSTNHYVELLPAMFLDQHEIWWARFPWLSAFKPFEGWSAANPTESLDWYDDYNYVKHNREDEFSRAKLKSALAAVSACFVMVGAQWGYVGNRPASLLGIETIFPDLEVEDCYHFGRFKHDPEYGLETEISYFPVLA